MEFSLALDIGGANIKAAHSSGAGASRPFALWKRPGDLPGMLVEVASQFPRADRVVVTMTAELCDCFKTKSEGVCRVIDAVEIAFPGRLTEIWGLDGRFHSVASIRDNPSLAAASNWLALATAVGDLARGRGVGLMIDIGSTTSDLIPLLEGAVAAAGRTDTERLRTGELVYAGVRRTPLCALADRLPFRGRATGLAAELFATTLDVYLTRGEIAENPAETETADGRPATVAAARDRLARMVGADREGFDSEDAARFAAALDEALVSRLVEAAGRSCLRRFGRPETVVVSGAGEFLARRVAERIIGDGGRVVSLAETWGPGPSSWACAHALLLLASRHHPGSARLLPSQAPDSTRSLSSRERPSVVKVGGSLLDWPELPSRLAAWLRDEQESRVVLIAGGGSVVDAIRALDQVQGLGEKRSHALAMRALDVTAALLAGLVPGCVVVNQPGELETVWNAGQTPVLAPRWFMEHVDAASPDPLPESWATTTDSIAARLAAHLGAGLVLLKSASPGPNWDRAEASREGFVNLNFPEASAGVELVRVLNLKEACGNVWLL